MHLRLDNLGQVMFLVLGNLGLLVLLGLYNLDQVILPMQKIPSYTFSIG